MAKKAQTAFDRKAVVGEIADSLIGLKGAEAFKDRLNSALRAAKSAGVKWGSQRDESSFATDIANAIAAKGANPNVLKQALHTVKWCYENSVVLTTTTASVMKRNAAVGAVDDLMTGKPKTIKAGSKGKTKGTKAKTQATVKHCGIGLLQALEQEGFVKWLNHFINKAEMMGIDSTSIDEEKLDLVRSTLVDCGFAVMEDGEYKAAIINAADNEVADDE